MRVGLPLPSSARGCLRYEEHRGIHSFRKKQTNKQTIRSVLPRVHFLAFGLAFRVDLGFIIPFAFLLNNGSV